MLNKEKNFVSAVVYVHNAENRIEEFLMAIIKVMESNFEHSEILCVNDSSDDDSINVILKTSSFASSTSVSLINMSSFHGVELSMNAGIDMSIGDFVFEFDNTVLDFSPDEIMNIYHKSLEGYDIVSASRDKKDKFTSNIFYSIVKRYTNLPYKITTESFRILSRRAINRVDSMNKNIPYRKIVYANCGLKTANIRYHATNCIAPPTDTREKHYRVNLAVDSIILFTGLGYSFAKFMTICMMFLSCVVTLYATVIYITANPVSGWTTTILFLSIAFFGLFGILTIIIKYLQLLVDLVFKRKHYNVESIIKITK